MLRPQIGIARQDQRPLVRHILAYAIVKCRSVEQRIHVVILRARSYFEIAAIRRQVRLSLIGPERVESLAGYIVPNDAPIPLGRIRIGCIDVRPLHIVGKAVLRRSIHMMQEPPILLDKIVEARVRPETRPYADHGLDVHGM